MIVCPVCEHPQLEGAECDVCGKKLAHGAAAAALAAVPAVEGLEPTLHAPALALEERLPDVEPTLHAAVPDPAAEGPPELESTRIPPVDVDAPPAEGLERTAADGIPDDAPTAVPASVLCRYCRTEAVPGDRICARCGMRLPVYAARTEGTSPAFRMCSCGVPVRGQVCPACGARTPSA